VVGEITLEIGGVKVYAWAAINIDSILGSISPIEALALVIHRLNKLKLKEFHE
jgi:hypothetical protein